jgi:hypothetical protein
MHLLDQAVDAAARNRQRRRRRSIMRRFPARPNTAAIASFVPMLPTGIGASTPHLTWSDAEL